MKRRKSLSVILICVFIILLCGKAVLAISIEDVAEPVEYTEEYKEWLSLTDEEKQKRIQPRMYEIPKTESSSISRLKTAMLYANSLVSKYSLKTYIPENMKVKNQGTTYTCWAFASLAALETNLAMKNYYNNVTAKEYDYSERHLAYSTTREFLNGKINENGFNLNVSNGGFWRMTESYLANGLGPISETEMPFENNSDTIDISEIQNKKVIATLYDTVDFPSYKTSEVTEEFKNRIKTHIKQNGAVYAGIHGASINNSKCLNNDTGAMYCKNSLLCKADHAIAIVGWDDNYAIENFNENQRPTKNGAWIIRNSWGEKIEYTLKEYKETIFDASKQQCITNGWSDATQIPDDVAIETGEKNGLKYENEKFVYTIGDNGYMYVSYEDINIYSNMAGIEKATDTVDYEKIYAYNELQYANYLKVKISKIYLANVFERDVNSKEFLKQVAINAAEQYTCKVYVNPNGDSKAQDDLQEVKLKEGSSETFEAGYHTLEFAKPIELKGDKFVVVIEISGSNNNSINYCVEAKNENTAWSEAKIEKQKCFFTVEESFNNNEWIDLGTQYSCDSTIKAFTTSQDDSLKEIKITSQPTKVEYVEGQNFDKTGMVVTAYYNNGKSKEITDYSIENGTNLKVGQTEVTIVYEDSKISQKISVEKNGVKTLRIKSEPTKTEYMAGEDFDSTGMIVEAEYKDGTIKTITNYMVENGESLKNGQNSVKIKYEDVSVEQEITVQKNPVVKLEITKEPNKVKYVVGQNFNGDGMEVKATYESGLEKKITNYTVEDGEKLKLDQDTVTISFEGISVKQSITVEEKKVVAININQKPNKTEYIVNKEELDLAGGEIKVTYNDNTEEIIEMSSNDLEIKGFDNKNVGKNIVTITYQEKSVEIELNIIEEKTIDEEPVNSNYDDSKATLIEVSVYNYENTDEKEYGILDIEISGIIKASGNDSMEYYYYISSNENEQNIENWIKITEEQKDDGKLKFSVDTKKIENYQEIVNADDIYIYIKEFAVKNGQQKVVVSDALLVDQTETEIKMYIDDKQKNESGSVEEEKDTTTAIGKIPQTGQTATIICIGLLLTGIGIIMYLKYKNIDR